MGRMGMAAALLAASSALQAQVVAPFELSQQGSCPMIHCTPEGTGLMTATLPLRIGQSNLVQRWAANDNPRGAGGVSQRPGFQSCSAGGGQFICLLRDGEPTALGVNTLPPPVNGSPASPAAFAVTESFRLKADVLGTSGSNPEVGLIGQDGSIIVADRDFQTRLVPNHPSVQNSGYTVMWRAPSAIARKQTLADASVTVSSVNPIDYTDADIRKTAIVVTYSDGQLFAFDPAKASNESSGVIGGILKLAAPASPPITQGNRLYYVARPGFGKTARIERHDLSSSGWSAAAVAHRDYNGTTGASPLLYRGSSGKAQVVLHVPNGDAGCGAGALSGDHLVGLDAEHLDCLYSTPLQAGIQVSPVLDPVKGGVWFYQYGAPVNGTTLQHLDENGTIVSADTITLSTLLADTGLLNPRFIGHLYSVMPERDRSGAPNVAPPVYVVGTIGENSGKGQKHALAICVARCPAGERTPSLAWVVPVTGFTANDSFGTAYGAALPLVSLYAGPGLPNTPGIVIAGGQYSNLNATGNILVFGEAASTAP